ncbi:DUF2752 domain-containing protein [Kitasatospora sp. NPDC004240]
MTTLTNRWQRSAGTLRGGLLRVMLRGFVAATAAVTVSRLHDAADPGVLCPLRLLTGVPCPGCGSTTVFIEAGHGSWGAALAANPVTAVAVTALLLAPLGLGRRWWDAPAGRRGALVAAGLAAAWVWELHRLGISRP